MRLLNHKKSRMSTLALDLDLLRAWVAEKIDEEIARERLIAKGFVGEILGKHVKEFRRLRSMHRQTTGFIITAIGAFLGFVSCILTMMDIAPAWNGFFLYGLTTVAVIITCLGLWYIFE